MLTYIYRRTCPENSIKVQSIGQQLVLPGRRNSNNVSKRETDFEGVGAHPAFAINSNPSQRGTAKHHSQETKRCL